MQDLTITLSREEVTNLAIQILESYADYESEGLLDKARMTNEEYIFWEGRMVRHEAKATGQLEVIRTIHPKLAKCIGLSTGIIGHELTEAIGKHFDKKPLRRPRKTVPRQLQEEGRLGEMKSFAYSIRTDLARSAADYAIKSFYGDIDDAIKTYYGEN